MTHDQLVERVLEAQDLLRVGLSVRDALHAVLNHLLKVKADEVVQYAEIDASTLDEDELDIKRTWAAARHAVSNPLGAAKSLQRDEH